MDAPLRDAALDRAYRDHAPDVYRLAYAVLRDRDDALDATHDAFARAWERWDRYDASRPLVAWLHGIATHVALDRLRRRRVRQIAIPALWESASTSARSGPEHDFASDVVRRHVVEEALSWVRPEARVALVLRHYYGYDYAHIASCLGTSSGTVGSILSRAHAELRRRLATADGADGSNASAPATRRSGRATPEPPEVLP